MGRRSLEATKLLWSLIVRAAVAFFRGACDFLAVDFFWLVAEEGTFELFFVADESLLGDVLDGDAVVCAGNPLPSSSNSTARLYAMRRLRNIGGLKFNPTSWVNPCRRSCKLGTFGVNPITLLGRIWVAGGT